MMARSEGWRRRLGRTFHGPFSLVLVLGLVAGASTAVAQEQFWEKTFRSRQDASRQAAHDEREERRQQSYQPGPSSFQPGQPGQPNQLSDLRPDRTPWRSQEMIDALERAVERYQAIVSKGGWPNIPGTQAIRPEDNDERVALLYRRLSVTGEWTRRPTQSLFGVDYSEGMEEAVRRFQENADLPATGALDNRTVAAINSPKRDKQIDTVIVNMERWRWLPRDLGVPALGGAYVILNIPDYTLKVMQHGAQVWTTRVVTGKPGTHATPLLTETMKYITVNPTWNVPPSIVYNEYLPALQQDPTVLQRMGLRLEQNRDGSVHISQPPGEANALGRIRFNFPNKFLVYQHDTPDKYLFEKSERAFSHGCMRVQYPDQYASILLNIAMPDQKWTPERIRSMYGSSEIDLKFPTPIPVNITYQTAFVDDAGKLQIRRDIYGRDATMTSLLKGQHNRDLENVIAHSQPGYSRPPTTLPPGVSFASNGGSFSSGPSFFERLFGGPPTPPAPVGRRQAQPNQRRVFTR